MRRYWIPKEDFRGDTASLQGEVFHHVCEVCRQGVGDRFEILHGDGQIHLVEITELGKKNAKLQVLKSRSLPLLKPPYLHLVLSVPRFPVLESVLEKSVELGVHTVHLVATDNSFLKKKDVIDKKWARWQKIISGACQQSARPTLMSLVYYSHLEEILIKINRDSRSNGLFLYEGGGDLRLKQAVQALKQDDLESIYFFVGSEGGFSQPEVELFRGQELLPVTMGEQVLRVETACVGIASILKYELQGDD